MPQRFSLAIGFAAFIAGAAPAALAQSLNLLEPREDAYRRQQVEDYLWRQQHDRFGLSSPPERLGDPRIAPSWSPYDNGYGSGSYGGGLYLPPTSGYGTDP